MTTKAQSTTKAKTPDAVKAAAAKPKAAPRVARGPKEKVLEQPADQAPIVEEQRQGERRQQVSNAMAQFTQSALTTPAVHEPTEEEKKLAALQEGVKALAASLGIDPAQVMAPTKQLKAPRADRQQQNNITHPNPESLCGKIWGLADKLSTERGDGQPVEVAKLRQHADMKQVNDHTLKTQFARWRSFNGFKGRTPAAQQAQPEQNRRADDAKPE